MTNHIAPVIGCNLGCTYSAVAGTRVLTADLEWVPIDELDLDDQVMAFDRPEQKESGEHTKLRTAPVTATYKYREEAVRVETDKGEVVVGSSHPFLSKYHGFRDAGDFQPGQEIRYVVEPADYEENDAYRLGYVHGAFSGDGTVIHTKSTKNASLRCQDDEIIETVDEFAPDEYGLRVKKQTTDGLHEIRTTIWDEVDLLDSHLPTESEKRLDNPDYCRGWLAGLFDTDGSFDGKAVRLQQKEGEVKETARICLSQLGYEYLDEPKSIRVRGNGVRFEFLAEIRPKVSRKVRNYEGQSFKGSATVESVEEIGERTFYDVTVDTYHTLVLEGFCSHNCYEEPGRQMTEEKVREEYDIDLILEKIDDWAERFPNNPPGLHGGEPLLIPKPHMRAIYERVKEHWEDSRPHIQTNGTLLDDDHIEIFKEFDVRVGMSCDGPAELNDERMARQGGEDVTRRMTQATHEAIDRVIDAGVNLGIIVVLHEQNAGTDERLEILLDWLDYLTENGVMGHYNPAIPYEDVQEDISLSPDRLGDVYIRTWEWMMEPGQTHRSWDPMRLFQDNLLGVKLGNCVQTKCDVYNTAAAPIINGAGETTGCGKGWDEGDGVPFLQGESTDQGWNETEERYEILKQIPGSCSHDDGEEYDEDIDLGGQKGCRYWQLTHAGCPGAGIGHDYRRRSIWHEPTHRLYERIENDMRRMFPKIKLVTDLKWDTPFAEQAKRGELDIKPFSNIQNSSGGPGGVMNGSSEHQVWDAIKDDLTFDEIVEYYKHQYPEESLTIEPENESIHADIP